MPWGRSGGGVGYVRAHDCFGHHRSYHEWTASCHMRIMTQFFLTCCLVLNITEKDFNKACDSQPRDQTSPLQTASAGCLAGHVEHRTTYFPTTHRYRRHPAWSQNMARALSSNWNNPIPTYQIFLNVIWPLAQENRINLGFFFLEQIQCFTQVKTFVKTVKWLWVSSRIWTWMAELQKTYIKTVLNISASSFL